MKSKVGSKVCLGQSLKSDRPITTPCNSSKLNNPKPIPDFQIWMIVFVYLQRSGPDDSSSRRVSDSQEITGSMFSFSTSEEGKN